VEFVTDMAAKRAELTPHRVAFRDVERGTSLTFGEVNAQANRIARALQGLGAGTGDRIGMLCHNWPEFFVLLFACQKAELVLVPLNWRQPAPELMPIVEMAKLRVIVHDASFAAVARQLAERFATTRVGLEDCGDGAPVLASLAAAASSEPVGAGRRKSSDVWYLLFTSGTTGMPKAVMQTFAMAWVNAVNIGQAVDLTSAERTVNFLPLFHTAGINLYTLPVFLSGGMSHVVRRFEPDALFDLIARGEVTAFFGVPAIYQAFSLHPRFHEVDLTRVRAWGCGGAPLPEALIKVFAPRGVRVRNGYGMTETGPTVFLADEAIFERKVGSVGRPQMLVDVRLADAMGNVIEGPGEGEVQMRGPGITPGYMWNDAATRAAFTPDGWLKSGDVARRDVDGDYFIVDRIKDMYISGGENVYPAEVEHVLNAHPAVLEAVVIGVSDAKWGEVGHAFLLLRPGQAIDIAALEPWCRKRIAAYKVPKAFEVVRDYPRTAAGKVQKHLLKARRP
jgi:fatty-acyl-CoA synthase